MNIIITGATGFVGTCLTKYLKDEGNNVLTLSLRNSWTLEQNANAIIHLAGKAHDTANTSEDEDYFNINTKLTTELFNKFIKTEIKDFIYFSSVKATADTVEGFLNEEHESNPKTAYGKSKLLAEEYLLSKKLPNDKRLFIIRPCMIHGPGNKGNLNLLYKVVEKGIPWPLAAFHNQRSFLSIDNLNFLINKLLTSDVPSGIYNFADDKSLSTNELVNLIGNVSGKKTKLIKIPQLFVVVIARLGDRLHLPLNSERLRKLTESYVVSNNKIKKALEIDQLPVTAEMGLSKTIKSFKN